MNDDFLEEFESGQQWEAFVLSILHVDGRFSMVRARVPMGPVEVDAVATSKEPEGVFLIEVKWVPRLDSRLLEGISVRLEFASGASDERVVGRVLVVPFEPEEHERSRARDVGIEVWGYEWLAALQVEHALRQSSIGDVVGRRERRDERERRSQSFMDRLRRIPPGGQAALKYQTYCAELVEFLFCPPLEDVQEEHSDGDRRNRRDILARNPATDGFWGRARSDYAAHYVVFDAKNYSGEIGKHPIVTVAYYLKPYGAGQLAVIFARRACGGAGEHAQRQVWINDRKLVVVAGDEDVRDMLKLKASGADPAEVLERLVMEFRLRL